MKSNKCGIDKGMAYFNLLEVMEKDCCPVCALTDKRIEQTMDNFLYDSVNSIPVQQEINAARGFCNFHADKLLKKGNPLAHAIIYGNLIEIAQKDIDVGDFMRYKGHAQCRWCALSKDNVRIYSRVFFESWIKDEFRRKYEEAGMLCMAHLHAVEQAGKTGLVNLSGKATVGAIRKATKKKYERICAQLAEVRRKNDFRFQNEPWTDEEKDAWSRAVYVINDRTEGK